MAFNEVIINGKVALSVRETDAVEIDVAAGEIFTKKDGTKAVGTYLPPPTELRDIEIDLSLGDQIILPAEGNLISKANILKPATLIPANILKGANVGGVIGELETNYPVLNAPTLAFVYINGKLLKLSITNPSTNGKFTKSYKIFNRGVFVAEKTTNIFDLNEFDSGSYLMSARVAAPLFNDSLNSNVLPQFYIYDITNNLVGLTSSNQDNKLIDAGQLIFNTKLVPDEGKFLPEFIDVRMGGIETGYTYNSYNGNITIADINNDISITGMAYDSDKLRTPAIKLDGFNLEVITPRYAAIYDLYSDGIIIKSFIANPEIVEYEVVPVAGALYGFAINSNGYYESQNKRIQSSYALCRVDIRTSSARTVRFNCISHGESTFDFGILSDIDTTLSLSNSTDSSNIKKHFSGIPSTAVQPVLYDFPEGDHFIYLKYRKDSSGDSGNDSLQFTVEFL